MFSCFRRKTYTITVFEAVGDWRFHARAKNGEILFQSEGYTRKEDAERAALALTRARMVMA